MLYLFVIFIIGYVLYLLEDYKTNPIYHNKERKQ